jgi:hypothetical protein
MAIEDLMADAPKADERRRALDRQLATLDAKIAQLTTAIETGGHLPTLLNALKGRETERTAIQTELQALTVRHRSSTEAGARRYRMRGTLPLGRIWSEILRSHGMASPKGPGLDYHPIFQGTWRSDRRAA